MKKTKKHVCSICDKNFDNARLLVSHQVETHKIKYCDICNHAFNNIITYKHHVRSHSNKGVQCKDCGKSFAYQSQLSMHSAVHSTNRFKCNHGSCTKSFKNQGDLTRHVKQHTSVKHKCPDCDYENVDICNFESHQLYHSRITKFKCENCHEEFIYNSQLQRHVKEKVCMIPKRSESPEY